jgi:hypothetical protein
VSSKSNVGIVVGSFLEKSLNKEVIILAASLRYFTNVISYEPTCKGFLISEKLCVIILSTKAGNFASFMHFSTAIGSISLVH